MTRDAGSLVLASTADGEPEATDKFSTIWYAGKARADSTWKFLVYDAKGELTLGPTHIHFTSSEMTLSIPWSDVIGVKTRNQTVASSLSFCFVGLASLFGLASGAMDHNHPVLYALASGIVYPILYLVFGSALARRFAKPWTVIRYRAERGEREAWFVDGARMGWHARGAGSTRLGNAVARHLSCCRERECRFG